MLFREPFLFFRAHRPSKALRTKKKTRKEERERAVVLVVKGDEGNTCNAIYQHKLKDIEEGLAIFLLLRIFLREYSERHTAKLLSEVLEYDEGSGFCYTAIHETETGDILLAYCAGGKGDKNCLSRLRVRKIAKDEFALNKN